MLEALIFYNPHDWNTSPIQSPDSISHPLSLQGTSYLGDRAISAFWLVLLYPPPFFYFFTFLFLFLFFSTALMTFFPLNIFKSWALSTVNENKVFLGLRPGVQKQLCKGLVIQFWARVSSEPHRHRLYVAVEHVLRITHHFMKSNVYLIRFRLYT